MHTIQSVQKCQNVAFNFVMLQDISDVKHDIFEGCQGHVMTHHFNFEGFHFLNDFHHMISRENVKTQNGSLQH